MFKERLLTTLILVPLVLGAIYYGPILLLSGVILLLLALLGWEWTQLIPLSKMGYKIIFLLILPVLILVFVPWLNEWLLLALGLWVFISIAIFMYPRSQAVWGYSSIVTLVGLCLLPLFACTFSALYFLPQGKDLVVYLLCLIWATDIGAYLVGKQWGRHKLIPHVSPGKSWEGALGGLFLAVLVMIIGYFYFKPLTVVMWFIVGIVTVFISMLGDLFISMLKRRCHLKDTGNILPGHGGILDRLDSMIAALPLFYLGLMFLNLGKMSIGI